MAAERAHVVTDEPLLPLPMGDAERDRYERAVAEKAKRGKHYVEPRGHAWTPGSGPAGETCGSCAHVERRSWAKTYLKCGLAKARWTNGRASDVRARDPACRHWESKDGPGA